MRLKRKFYRKTKISKKLSILILFVFFTNSLLAQELSSKDNTEVFPVLEIKGDAGKVYTYSFQIAMGNIFSNIKYYKGGLLKTKKLCLFAGIDYAKPWTRDAAINVWNGAGLIFPSISKNTLLAQLEEVNNKLVITGQYWDKIIWSIGAWNYYLYTGDKQFLELAFNATVNTLKELASNEFDPSLNLFRGAAVYGDGVAAYPIYYTTCEDTTKNGSFSGILDWLKYNPNRKYPHGKGLPMHALSTNAVYYKVYTILSQMATELRLKSNPDWEIKARKIKDAINKYFWNSDKNTYRYLVDPNGNVNVQESLGISFAVLFNIADEDQINNIFKNIYVAPAGIPCVYPSFKRYINKNPSSFGRHSGAVWPHIEGFWAEAAAKSDHTGTFEFELNALAKHAARDLQFVEIYNPITGQQYGGMQEPTLKEGKPWNATNIQTWSATAYLRMILRGLFGMTFSIKGITFNPVIPFNNNGIVLRNIHYGNSIINIYLNGKGNKVESFKINGINYAEPFLNAEAMGTKNIFINIKPMTN
jgi:Mannosylglycerate hydrolase MGH1-like glycoside hydrolase domain